MTDGQYLLLLFATLYLIECLRWRPAASRVLHGSRRRWASRRPLRPVEVARRHPALLGVLPPLQVHTAAMPWLAIPAGEELELYTESKSPVRIPWGKVTVVVHEAELVFSSSCKIRCLSETHARQWEQQIQAWKTMSPGEREAAFLKLATASLSEGESTAALEKLEADTRALRWLGGLLFVFTFGVLSVIYRWVGEGLEVLIAAGVLFVLMFVQAVLFFRRARGLPHRFLKALPMALLPQHSIRAADLLCDAALAKTAPHHPLAYRVLLGDGAWKKLAGEYWRAVKHQAGPAAALQKQALESYFKGQGIALEDLELKPERQAGSAAYCPVCQAQFQAEAKHCRDCGGVELKAF